MRRIFSIKGGTRPLSAREMNSQTSIPAVGRRATSGVTASY
jgi:hypothetical protein